MSEQAADPAGGAIESAPLDARRRVFALAIPALGEQFLNFCVSLFDTYLAGQVSTGEHGVGVYTTTVGIAAYISWLATLIFSLVGTGTTALVARARGGGDFERANRFANRSLAVAGGLGLVVYVLLTVLAPLYAQMQQMHGEAYRVAVRFLRVDAAASHSPKDPAGKDTAAPHSPTS